MGLAGASPVQTGLSCVSMTFPNPQANYAFRFFHTSEENSLLEIPLETAEFRGTCDRLDTGARNKKSFSSDLRPLAFCSVAGHLLRLSLTRDTEEPFCGPWGSIIGHKSGTLRVREVWA